MSKMSAERETFLADIVVTAVEGGINYWSMVKDYHWYSPDLDGGTAIPGANGGGYASATVLELDYDGLAEEEYKLTPFVVARGIRRILRGDVEMGERFVANLKLANRENDAGYLDALDADVIVQAGIFEEVVYG